MYALVTTYELTNVNSSSMTINFDLTIKCKQ